jgi:hypothetical protein
MQLLLKCQLGCFCNAAEILWFWHFNENVDVKYTEYPYVKFETFTHYYIAICWENVSSLLRETILVLKFPQCDASANYHHIECKAELGDIRIMKELYSWMDVKYRPAAFTVLLCEQLFLSRGNCFPYCTKLAFSCHVYYIEEFHLCVTNSLPNLNIHVHICIYVYVHGVFNDAADT